MTSIDDLENQYQAVLTELEARIQQTVTFLQDESIRGNLVVDQPVLDLLEELVRSWFRTEPQDAAHIADLSFPAGRSELLDRLHQLFRRDTNYDRQTEVRLSYQIDAICRQAVSRYRTALFQEFGRPYTPGTPTPAPRSRTPGSPTPNQRGRRRDHSFSPLRNNPRTPRTPPDDAEDHLFPSFIPHQSASRRHTSPTRGRSRTIRPILQRPGAQQTITMTTNQPAFNLTQFVTQITGDLQTMRNQIQALQTQNAADQQTINTLQNLVNTNQQTIQTQQQVLNQQAAQQQDYKPDYGALQALLKEVKKFDGSNVDEFCAQVEHALMAGGAHGARWFHNDLADQPAHARAVAASRRVLAIISTRMIPEVQEQWRLHFNTTHATIPTAGGHQANAVLGGSPITWTNANNTTPFGPSAFRSTHGVGTNHDYPTMKQWLVHTYPQGTAAIITPETVKLQKIDWSKASYGGEPGKFNEWVQTILAIKKANRVPDVIPAGFERQITESIAIHFTGQASETWLNTPENQRPRHVGTADPADNDNTKIIVWVRQKFRSQTHELVKHQELQVVKWNPQSQPIHQFNETFNTLLTEAGYGPGRPLAEKFKVDWYLNALPGPLATAVRNTIIAADNDRTQLNAQLASLQRPLMPPYEATLRGVQASAVTFRTEYQMYRQKDNLASSSNPQKRKNNNNTQEKINPKTVTCYTCKKEGHVATDCPEKNKGKGERFCKGCGTSHPEGKHTKAETMCPMCKVVHKWGEHVKPTKTMYAEDVPAYKAKDEPRRAPDPTEPSLYVKGLVKDQKANIILDTGARLNIVSSAFLKKTGLKIDAPSTHALVQVEGKRVHPLGSIKALPVELDTVTFTVPALVLDVTGYDLILGTRWIRSVESVLDMKHMNITLRLGREVLVLPMFGRHEVVRQEDDEAPAFKKQENLKDEAVYYNVDEKDWPTPLSDQDYQQFTSAYIWTRLRMGQKHPKEDVSGLRCAAGRTFCSECYSYGYGCEMSRESRVYWRLYRRQEPAHWKLAAQKIINNRRSKRSPLYEECSDNWSEVLCQAFNLREDRRNECILTVLFAWKRSRAVTQTAVAPIFMELTNSDSEEESVSTASVQSSEYSADPDWAWLVEEGYVSDTSSNYEALRPQHLKKPRLALPADMCKPPNYPYRHEWHSDDDNLPLWCPTPRANPIPADQFWETISVLPQYQKPANDFRLKQEVIRVARPPPPPIRRANSPSQWGLSSSDNKEWPSYASCSCTGWCDCDQVNQAF